MLKELKLHNGILINTDDISTITRQDAPKRPVATSVYGHMNEYVYENLQMRLIECEHMSPKHRDFSWRQHVEAIRQDIDNYKQWKNDTESVTPDDPQHKYVVLMKNKDTYYLTKKEYDSFRCEHPYSPMDEVYNKFKESLGLGFDKELRITNSEVIHRDGNSIQLKLTCEF